MEDKELIQVYVKSIYTSQNNNNYRVIELGETNGNRVMKVVLGMFEADFIAAALNNKIFKRPMPYSVMNDAYIRCFGSCHRDRGTYICREIYSRTIFPKSRRQSQ